MSNSLDIGAVLRRTFGIYAAQAPLLVAAALLVAEVLELDEALRVRATVLGAAAGLVDLLALGVFVGVVVLVAADVRDGGARRGVGGLLRGAWSALGRLLLAGVVAVLVIALVTSIGSAILVVVIFGFVAGSRLVEGVLLSVLVFPVVVLVPELFLCTIWSVFVAVAVLERPGGLGALGRSRELVRGNDWRVLALILTLAVPLVLIVSALNGLAQATGGGAAVAVRLLLATVVAPVPALASTVLYFELRRAEPTPAFAGPAPPVLPPEALVS